MSWKLLANPILYLALVFLLAGDLGSQISVNAYGIECTYSWHLPFTPQGKYQCVTAEIPESKKGKKDGKRQQYYSCSWCGRGDNKPSSCYDCATQNGVSVTGPNGSWDCPAGIDTQPGLGERQYVCSRFENSVQVDYYCKRRHLNQACPSELCKAITA
ncbi:uncharacterized protein MELLADRAFT_123888 [Melampsora larici-populina 98AG31]|uniref:Secreted protein n=1 Tax=Melampsora larici-populina (strain 98AG31 / pathotype 3-4-7) TaxID=747676 RepID=F4RGV2_MELLP|nr:uncharacterized protein MELLADRAFT_123888 [Melampsora larici-populina 98AG31]EGG08204.1 secreted protein [Melampsora larici-populina 98AG31]